MSEKTNCRFFNKNCPDKAENEGCPEGLCIPNYKMTFMLQHSNLKKPQTEEYNFEESWEDRKAYLRLDEIITEFPQWITTRTYNSLYIWSHNYLNGKTTWAIKLLQNYLTEWAWAFNKEWSEENSYGYFITTSQIKEIFKYQTERQEDFINLTKILKTTKLLVIDNIEQIIDDLKVENYLANILDERFSAKLSTIYTSHISPNEYKSKCKNSYLNSRIIDLSENNIVEFNAPVYHKEKGEN